MFFFLPKWVLLLFWLKTFRNCLHFQKFWLKLTATGKILRKPFIVLGSSLVFSNVPFHFSKLGLEFQKANNSIQQHLFPILRSPFLHELCIWFQLSKIFVPLPPKFVSQMPAAWAFIFVKQRSCQLGQTADGVTLTSNEFNPFCFLELSPSVLKINVLDAMSTFFSYVEKQGFQSSFQKKLSVHGKLRKTISEVKVFHSSFGKRIVRKRPNFWFFSVSGKVLERLMNWRRISWGRAY